MKAAVGVVLGVEENGGTVDWGNLDMDYKNYSVR